MTTASQFKKMKKIEKGAKKAGFSLVAFENDVTLEPVKGVPFLLFSESPNTYPSFSTLDHLEQYLDGWCELLQYLEQYCGLSEEEIKDRILQHKVLNTLKSDSNSKSKK